MNVTVNSQVLATELRLLNKVVPTKPAIAILSHALLRAEDGLTLQATDLEVSLTAPCQARVDAPGSVALPVGKLLQLVEQFTDGDVCVRLEGAHVVIKCGAFTSRMQSLPARDFPTVPTAEGVTSVLDAASFLDLIARTRYAVNAASSKVTLRGALLTLAGPVAAMVSTDSRRLALATAHRPDGPDQQVLVPVKALDALVGSMEQGDLELTSGPRQLSFTLGGRVLSSRILDGEFPAYQRIIPRDNDKVVTADRPQLLALLRRVLVAAETNGATYLSFEPKRLHVAARSSEVGSADEAMAVDYEGPALKVCVNGTYLQNFLDAARNTTVIMKLKDDRGAMLLMDGENNVGVVMLMRG